MIMQWRSANQLCRQYGVLIEPDFGWLSRLNASKEQPHGSACVNAVLWSITGRIFNIHFRYPGVMKRVLYSIISNELNVSHLNIWTFLPRYQRRYQRSLSYTHECQHPQYNLLLLLLKIGGFMFWWRGHEPPHPRTWRDYACCLLPKYVDLHTCTGVCSDFTPAFNISFFLLLFMSTCYIFSSRYRCNRRVFRSGIDARFHINPLSSPALLTRCGGTASLLNHCDRRLVQSLFFCPSSVKRKALAIKPDLNKSDT